MTLTNTKKIILCTSIIAAGITSACDSEPEATEMVRSPVPYDPETQEFDPSGVEELPLEDAMRDGEDVSFRWFVPLNKSSLTSVGGNGGFEFDTIGEGIIYGFGGRAGSVVDQLTIGFHIPAGHAGLQYQAGDIWDIVQIADDDGGSAFGWTACPAGYGAIGFKGRAGGVIDKFGLICANFTNPAAWYYTPQRGGNGGAPFTRLCPAGKWLIGLDGRADDVVDRLTGLCANL